MADDVTFTDSSAQIKRGLQEAIDRAMKASLLVLEAEAKSNAKVISGGLRSSITHQIKGSGASTLGIIGSPLEYAKYVEYGTGEKAEKGAGRKGYWVFVKGSTGMGASRGKSYTLKQAKQIMAIMRKDGKEAYYTNGIRPQKFFRGAFEAKKDVVKTMLAKELRGEFG